MMLTKEQFEMTKDLASLHAPDEFEDRACKTIEALREVARAAKWTYPGGIPEGRLGSALDALPDWLNDG